jgi:hypothetical protein
MLIHREGSNPSMQRPMDDSIEAMLTRTDSVQQTPTTNPPRKIYQSLATGLVSGKHASPGRVIDPPPRPSSQSGVYWSIEQQNRPTILI